MLELEVFSKSTAISKMAVMLEFSGCYQVYIYFVKFVQS